MPNFVLDSDELVYIYILYVNYQKRELIYMCVCVCTYTSWNCKFYHSQPEGNQDKKNIFLLHLPSDWLR